MKVTPEGIRELQPPQVFVFGSNLAGRHGKGAARFAAEEFGAQEGVGWGFTGDCYAIPTKNADLQVLPLDTIQSYIRAFLEEAAENNDWEFLVTKIGCGLSGYSSRQIAPLFGPVADIPPNVSLPIEFWNVLRNSEVE